MDGRVLVFARYPVAGEAKTRLAPSLGPDRAARLHRRMAEHAVKVAREACGGAHVTVCFTGAPAGDFRAWLGADLRYRAQPGGDLGERLRRAFAEACRSGPGPVAAIGADVPGLTPQVIRTALDSLRERDVVVGPAADGGYYLVGMAREQPRLFEGIAWGTGLVCEQSLAAAKRLGLTVALLPPLPDIDRPEDLPPLRCDPRFSDVWNDDPALSVVIPTLDEESALGATLTRVRGEAGVEIVVADGGSRDATREVAARHGATVLEVAGGRAAQLNAGAAAAAGRHLLFLHADTLLPAGYRNLIRGALARPSTVAGAFRLRTDGAGPGIRLMEWGANLRSRAFRLPYGDQGLFLEKRVFDEVGGFAALPIMEDYELVVRLRRRGPVVTLAQSVVTSARRWRRLGVLRTFARNQAMVAGFRLGIAPGRLARFYRGRPG